jgi:hypothetical protein
VAADLRVIPGGAAFDLDEPYEPMDVGDRNVIDVTTRIARRFLGMPDDEPTELTFFVRGRVQLAHALTPNDHIRLLHDAEKIPGFNGAYQLLNPINTDILARYPSNQIIKYPPHRAADSEITARRALFVDIDPQRPKGISATDTQKREAHSVSASVEDWLVSIVGRNAIARGDSGNGYFLLVAIEPRPVERDDRSRISNLLKLMNRKFGTGNVKIDDSVFNAARLMPAAGTMKRKGHSTPERPHRRTAFCCRANIERVPLEALC